MDDTEEEVINKLCFDKISDEASEGFPQQKDCGGFEIMQCLANSRDLAIIDCSLSSKCLKARLGGSQGKAYIRPIHKSLSTKPIVADHCTERNEACLICKTAYYIWRQLFLPKPGC